MVACKNFGTKFFLREGECRTREKPRNLNFARKGKMVIFSELFLDFG